MSNLQVYADHLEQRANLLRDRLLCTLDELDRRRHALVSVRAQARRHPGALALLGAALLLGIGGGAALAVRRVRTRDERRRRERMNALRRLWSHPERVAREERGVLRSLGMRVLAGMATAAAMWLLRRGWRFTLELATAPEAAPRLARPARGELAPAARAEMERATAAE